MNKTYTEISLVVGGDFPSEQYLRFLKMKF